MSSPLLLPLFVPTPTGTFSQNHRARWCSLAWPLLLLLLLLLLLVFLGSRVLLVNSFPSDRAVVSVSVVCFSHLPTQAPERTHSAAAHIDKPIQLTAIRARPFPATRCPWITVVWLGNPLGCFKSYLKEGKHVSVPASCLSPLTAWFASLKLDGDAFQQLRQLSCFGVTIHYSGEKQLFSQFERNELYCPD